MSTSSFGPRAILETVQANCEEIEINLSGVIVGRAEHEFPEKFLKTTQCRDNCKH